ncbi:MAG: 4-hydroxythreonine-4-phosphate dehydrogenase PdxA [Bacteroidales bacterium]|nr:4-hydroxythreonine-4-phosphate dehydrogenase PdxA [Bacteroidales bacterium]
METVENKIKVGITHGDINGIGYEIIIKTLIDKRINDFCIPIVYGSPKLAAYHRKAVNIENFSLNIIKSPEGANPKRPNIINCVNEETRIELGKSTSESGEAAYLALEKAVNDLIEHKIDVLLTAPINKKSIKSEKFNFPGHTEYLQNKTNTDEVLMLMLGEKMKIGVVTGHVPVRDISSLITEENILKKLRILNKSLLEDFTIRKAKIAVLGLNPHAGDDGVIGSEEKEIIIPAINKARDEGIMAVGPYPADGFFGSGAYLKFDAVLAMYHDQGLAPFKAIDFENGVNYTAGLPVIRTSPIHGTAFEIAGEGIASADSFRKALFTGIEIFKNRKMYKETSKNKLSGKGENQNI